MYFARQLAAHVAAGPIGQRAALNETRADATALDATAWSQPGQASAGTKFHAERESGEEFTQDLRDLHGLSGLRVVYMRHEPQCRKMIPRISAKP